MRLEGTAVTLLVLFGAALTSAGLEHVASLSARDRARRGAQQPGGPAGDVSPGDAGASAPGRPSASAVVSAPSSSPPADAIACQSDLDCRRPGPRGRCFTAAMAAQYSQSLARCEPSGTWAHAHPVGYCLFDECRDADSAGGDTCPSGQRCGTLDMAQLPNRVCVTATCTSDFQCRREVGGRCAGYLATGRCARGGWACAYPTDPCAPRNPSRMCPQHNGEVAACRPSGPRGRFVCASEPVVPQGPVQL